MSDTATAAGYTPDVPTAASEEHFAGAGFSHPNMEDVESQSQAERAPLAVKGDDFSDVDVQDVDAPPPAMPGFHPFTQAWWNKRRKNKAMIAGAALLIFNAIMIPIFIFVILPKLAQHYINQSDMRIISTNITNPNATSFDVQLDAIISNAGPFPADVSFSSPVLVSWLDPAINSPVALLTMDPYTFHISGGGGELLQNISDAQVVDVNNFGRFNHYMINNAEFTWYLTASVKVRTLGLSASGISMNKTVTVAGMSGFQNVSIVSFDLPKDDNEGIYMSITNSLFNPSPVGVQLDLISFDVYIPGNDTKIGSITSLGTTYLAPGTNVIPFNGTLTHTYHHDKIVESNLFSLYLGGTNTSLNVVGTGTNGGEVPWLTPGVVGLKLNVPFVGNEKGRLVKSVTVTDMTLDFTGQGASFSPLVTSKNVSAVFKSPFNFPINISQSAQNIVLSYEGVGIGVIDTPMSPSNGSTLTGILTTDIVGVPLAVYNTPAAQAAFKKFQLDVTTSTGNVVAHMSGSANVNASTNIGPLAIDGLLFDSDLTIKGLGGLVQTSVLNVTVASGTPAGIVMNIPVTIFNPSNVELRTGTVVFDMVYANTTVGTVTMPNLDLQMGLNTLVSQALYSPSPAASAKGLELLTRYVTGDPELRVDVVGSTASTALTSLQPALSTIHLRDLSLGAPITKKLINSTSFSLSLNQMIAGETFVDVVLYNPFDADIYITDMNADIVWTNPALGQDYVIGRIAQSGLGITMHGGVNNQGATTAVNGVFVMQLNLGAPSIRALLSTSGTNELEVTIRSVIGNKVGGVNGYPISLTYSQVSTTRFVSA
ncbi:hypothetical protein BDK51DRAFT_25722 [Blyttiomyces helicus]|uniref:Pre-rRNA processing protein n=1 Tax=Blyttiomyces helicus TaxID=388810 RepID=A0A4P9WHS2_9FUNG|nr:hypothetical protein BDK51DRAFT_25722 [Blyttiomyces helicus]|eukprot:RKO91393.1 hypothetical protein BDK51DRAFT_25722 [Blyttiomyces helicus]